MEIVGSTKRCSTCGETKPIEDFRKWNTRCRVCRNADARRYRSEHLEERRAYQREFMAKHPEYGRNWAKRNPASYRNKTRKLHLKVTYGITPEDYQRMYDKQSGLWAICGKPETSKRFKNLAVDHDHQTGKVRSLLCHHCNTAIGSMDDSPERLRRAAEYLDSWRFV